jgi:hypothetical protein
MQNEQRQADLTGLITMMSSLVAHFLVHREIPTPYLDALVQHVSAFLQDQDIAEVESDDGC